MLGSRSTASKVLRLAGWLTPMAFFGRALWVLHGSLQEYRYSEIVAAFRKLTKARLAFALVIATYGYLVLAGYDMLPFRFICRALRLRDLALAAFVLAAAMSTLCTSRTLRGHWGTT
jgi:uncharacterized membrane protein YbhN (UPF0104 family)